MIQYFLDVTLSWSFFYFIYLILLRKETFFGHNRLYLLSTLLAGLLIPLLRYVSLVQSPEETSFVYSFGEQVYAVGHAITVEPESNFTFINVLFWVFWSGVLWCTIRLILGLAKIVQLYRHGDKYRKGSVFIVQTTHYHLPFSFFKWVFWSKEYPLRPELRNRIIQHEGVHAREMHSLDVLLVEILGIFFWWNPLIYQYRRSLRVVHEYVADHTVLETTELNTYKSILLNQKMSGLQLALTHQFFHSQLKNRIMMMSKNPSSPFSKWKYLLLVPIAALLISVFAFKISDGQPLDDKMEILTQDLPLFPGCEKLPPVEQDVCSEERFLEFVYKTIKYPAVSRKNLTVGLAALSFEVSEKGYITIPKIMESLDPVIDAELMRVFTELKAKHPKWTPKVENGAAVSSTVNLPVEFRLEGDGNESKTHMPPELKEKYADRAVVTAYLPQIKNELQSEDIPKAENRVFQKDQVQRSPVFPGCEQEAPSEQKACSEKKFLEFIRKTVKYPAISRKNQVVGTVVLTFQVDHEGHIKNPKIKEKLDPIIDQEMMRVFADLKKAHPKWTPNTVNGSPVSATMTLPVEYRLKGDGSESSVLDFMVGKNRSGEGVVVIAPMPSTKNPSKSGYIELKNEEDHNPNANEVLIKGSGTLFNGKEPLIFLDGVEIGNTNSKEFKNINPGDILSINVMKGEKAIEKYGRGAQDGVILIATKKGVDNNQEFKDSISVKLQSETTTKTKVIRSNKNNHLHREIKGIVVNQEGQPLIGTTIIVKGTETGTITDVEGRFALKLPQESTILIFSYVGYQKEEVFIENRNEIRVTLQKPEANSNNSLSKEIFVENKLEVREFGAFPNPTKDLITLRFIADLKPTTIRIQTPSGQELFKKILPNFKGDFDEEIKFKATSDGWVLLSIQQDDKLFSKVILIQ